MKKRKNIKRALLLVLLLLLTFAAAASAATTYTHKYFNYEMDGESVVITNYFGSESTVTVPSLISGYPVSKIAKNAFTQNDKVKHVNLPDTIMEVEEGAFSGSIGVTYASNTDNPVDTIPEVEPETTAPDKDMNNGAVNAGNVKEEAAANGSSTSDAETESQDSPFSTPTISDGVSSSSNASAEVSAEEVEAQILALEESQKKNDASNSVSDTEVLAETESETTLSAETEITEVTESQSETEAMTESELESETEEAADSGKDFPFAVAAVAVIAVLAVVCIVWRRKK